MVKSTPAETLMTTTRTETLKTLHPEVIYFNLERWVAVFSLLFHFSQHIIFNENFFFLDNSETESATERVGGASKLFLIYV